MRRIDFTRINAAARPRHLDILRAWLPDGRVVGPEYLARNPRRVDSRPGAICVNISSGRWADYAIGERGDDIISLAAYLFAMTQVEAARAVGSMLGLEAWHVVQSH
jgi:hypothetical protein